MLQHACDDELRKSLGIDPYGDIEILRSKRATLKDKVAILRERKNKQNFPLYKDRFLEAGGLEALFEALAQALYTVDKEKSSFQTKRRALDVLLIRLRSGLAAAQARVQILEKENVKLHEDLRESGIFLHRFEHAQHECEHLILNAQISNQVEVAERSRRFEAEEKLTAEQKRASQELEEYARRQLEDERTIIKQNEAIHQLKEDLVCWKAASNQTFVQECRRQAVEGISVGTQTRGLSLPQSVTHDKSGIKDTQSIRKARPDSAAPISKKMASASSSKRPQTAPSQRQPVSPARDLGEDRVEFFRRLSRPRSRVTSRSKHNSVSTEQELLHFNVLGGGKKGIKVLEYPETREVDNALTEDVSQLPRYFEPISPRFTTILSAAERVRPRSAVQPRGSHFVSAGLGLRKPYNPEAKSKRPSSGSSSLASRKRRPQSAFR